MDDKKKPLLAVAFGIGKKPKLSSDDEGDDDKDEDDDEEKEPKSEDAATAKKAAGKALLEALKSDDPMQMYDAFEQAKDICEEYGG